MLGNVQYTQLDDDHAAFDPAAAEFVAAAEAMLKCGPLLTNLTSRLMKGNEKGLGSERRASFYTIEYSRAQAESVRDAVIKAVYTHLFDWIVDKVNVFIVGSESAAALPYVGLLDIFGFENFAHNSFEQLCINFANEKLQQFFLMQVFKEEEALHVLEGVAWKEVEYQDNSACIEMLEKPPNGLLRLLDSQCKAPRASEEALCKEVNQLHAKGGFLAPTRTQRMRDEEGFIVRHYAGDVAYHTSAVVAKSTGANEVSFLEKNNDTLQEDWLAQLAGSEVPLLRALFQPRLEAARQTKPRKAGAPFSSVGKRFVNDLNSLLAELKTSKAHFVRCVKPSAGSKPRDFEAPLVLDQLRCAGVVEAVRVMTEAYPTRIPYEVIHGRYAPLMGAEVLESTGDEPAAFCEAVALACDVAPRDYALGLSKLFLKAGCGGFLEDLASMDTAVVVPLLVAKIAESRRKKGAEKIVGNAVIGWYLHKTYKAKRAAAEIAQHRLRTIRARREYYAWSTARAERLAAEAAERATAEKTESARREAEEVARATAAAAHLKDKEVTVAVAKATAEAETRVAVEMEAAAKQVEAAAAENAALNAAKQSVDRRRPDYGEGMRRGSSKALQGAFGAEPLEPDKEAEEAAEAAAAAAAAGGDVPSFAKARSEYSVTEEESFDVLVVRDVPGGTLGIAVDLWDGEVTVGAISTGGPADREGTLVQGDVIKGVEGAACGTIEEVTAMVVKGPGSVRLSVVRRPVSVVLESEIRMRMPTGEWEPFAFRLLSNRNIEFEKLSPPVYAGEIHARLAQSLKLLPGPADSGAPSAAAADDRVLEIVTGHKHFQIKCLHPRELDMWQLRLQEVIMLQEKVANVAHGWLLKEEAGKAGVGTQFKHYWFVLFSNGILMYFEGPQRAVLGQALGFVPVEQCHEHSQAHMHTITITCSFTTWLLATKNKESMLQWAASLKVAQPAALAGASAKPAIDAVLAQGWCELPREEAGGEEVWHRHWFVLKPSVLQIFSEEQKEQAGAKGALAGEPAEAVQSTAMLSAYRAQGVDFYKWGIVLETADGPAPLRLRATGQSEMRQLLSTLNVNCIPVRYAAGSRAASFEKTRVQLKAGWLFKKNERRSGVAPVVKAWQRRWFVLEVATDAGPTEGTVVRTAQLSYHHSVRELQRGGGVVIPLQEAKSARAAAGKTKGTEHRVTLSTHKREWELGAVDQATADEWLTLLGEWIGLPRVEPREGPGGGGGGAASVVRSHWMEVKVQVCKPDEIPDEELQRTASIQKGPSSFSRSFSLFKSPKGAKEAKPEDSTEATTPKSTRTASERGSLGGSLDGEVSAAGEVEEEEEPPFRWVFVALLSDGTLRRYETETMATELGRLKLGYLVQAGMLEERLHDYEHAFRVRPESATSDAWILCPDSAQEAAEWIATLRA